MAIRDLKLEKLLKDWANDFPPDKRPKLVFGYKNVVKEIKKLKSKK